MNLRILYQDQHLIAVDKPAGFHVHPPEDQRHAISNSVNCLYLLRKQIERYLYPIHRLDRATSGVLVFGLNPNATRKLSEDFRNHKVEKKYLCVLRGWTEDSGKINTEIGGVSSLTEFKNISRTELPFANKQHPSSRYSLVWATPVTGRTHQLRRHFAHLRNPIIGDKTYGDSAQNRIFSDKLGISGLCLKSYTLKFNHPITGENIFLQSRWGNQWLKVFDAFSFCPISY